MNILSYHGQTGQRSRGTFFYGLKDVGYIRFVDAAPGRIVRTQDLLDIDQVGPDH
jgi:hypothetical protein